MLQKGFHEGKMIIGKYKGEKVTDAKPLVKNDLINEKLAVQYYEPNGNVVSRSEITVLLASRAMVYQLC